jgi:hypothetical protein
MNALKKQLGQSGNKILLDKYVNLGYNDNMMKTGDLK